MLQQLSAAAPTNATLRHYLAESYDAYADVYASKGDLERSSRFLRETRAIYQQLAAADPSDKMSRANLAWSDLAIAENLLRQNKVEDAMPLIREGLALFEKKSNPSKGYWFAVEVGQSYLDLGRAWAMLAQSAPSSRNRTQFWQNAVASDQNALAIRTLDPTALDANGHDQLSDIRRQLVEAEAALR